LMHSVQARQRLSISRCEFSTFETSSKAWYRRWICVIITDHEVKNILF